MNSASAPGSSGGSSSGLHRPALDYWINPLDCGAPGLNDAALAAKRQLEQLLLERLSCGDVCGTVLDAVWDLLCATQPRPILVVVLVLSWAVVLTLLMRGLAVRLVR